MFRSKASVNSCANSPIMAPDSWLLSIGTLHQPQGRCRAHGRREGTTSLPYLQQASPRPYATTILCHSLKDIITPIIGIFGGLPDFSAWAFTINGSKFLIGDFINVVVAFVILAAIIYYLVVLPVQRMMERYKPEQTAAPETTRDCPYCLSKIPLAASKCAFCTADAPPGVAQPVP